MKRATGVTLTGTIKLHYHYSVAPGISTQHLFYSKLASEELFEVKDEDKYYH